MDKIKRQALTQKQLQYQKENLVRVSVNFSKNTDRDILEALEQRGKISMQAYIKKILRDNIVG